MTRPQALEYIAGMLQQLGIDKGEAESQAAETLEDSRAFEYSPSKLRRRVLADLAADIDVYVRYMRIKPKINKEAR